MKKGICKKPAAEIKVDGKTYKKKVTTKSESRAKSAKNGAKKDGKKVATRKNACGQISVYTRG